MYGKVQGLPLTPDHGGPRADTKNEWKDSTPTLERSASGGIKVTGLCAGGRPTDYDGDFGDGNHPDGGDYIPNGMFSKMVMLSRCVCCPSR